MPVFGIGLGELVLAILIVCAAAWIINKFAQEPWKTRGLWILGVFVFIYVVERLHVFELLQKISI